jgi:hypothetical protein
MIVNFLCYFCFWIIVDVISVSDCYTIWMCATLPPSLGLKCVRWVTFCVHIKSCFENVWPTGTAEEESSATGYFSSHEVHQKTTGK